MPRLVQVVVASARKWKVKVPIDHSTTADISSYVECPSDNGLYEVLEKHSAIRGSRKVAHTKAFR